tara:strand:+ start:5756 stop:7060 length:1305 start_codon:yes stop_codon:yes gene_type:complete
MRSPKKLWMQCKLLIPGGNGLISKRPERYSEDKWPTFYKKSKGLNVWDLNGKKYKDMSQMGIGTCVLGYANHYIDKRVKKAIDTGVNSTLNSTEELKLAKKILKHDKFAQKVKFARGGGEAMAIAVRIARAARKKDFVAFSGYHGWYDWYLATNLKGKNRLKNHLLPGLEPLGVPKALKNTIFGFRYNDCDDFKKRVKNKNLAAIVVEGCRFQNPNRKFVREINKFCEINNVCLIVDEITSGWRNTIGGVYKKFGLKPDIVIYGKGIGNGYAISCIVGKKKYLDYANESFISSTAWTERVGFVAANSTIDFFLKNNVHLKIEKNGEYLINEWKLLSTKHGLKINFSENPALASFYFDYSNQVNSKLYKFFTDRMLDYNYLAGNSIYLSYAHKKSELNSYLKICDKVFKEIKNLVNNHSKIYKLKSRKESFKRLT